MTRKKIQNGRQPKIQNVRRPKKSIWKTTKIIQNGRRLKKIKMKDDQND